MTVASSCLKIPLLNIRPKCDGDPDTVVTVGYH